MSYEDALEAIQASETEEERIDAFRTWRAEVLLDTRKFVGESQAEFGRRLKLSQQGYAKFEQARGWKGQGEQIINLLQVPKNMLQNHITFQEFCAHEGARTFLRMLEETISRWTRPDDDATADPKIPLIFIRGRVQARQNIKHDDGIPERVTLFLRNPEGNDLDQDAKRWFESLLQLQHGSISDPHVHQERKGERKRRTEALRSIFSDNVGHLLASRNWTAARLASEMGIPLEEVGNDAAAFSSAFYVRNIVAVASAFRVEPWQLLMEKGPEIGREAAGAFAGLPAYVRWSMAWLQRAVTEEVDGNSSASAQAVTGLLPGLIAVLKYAQQEAGHNPKLVDAARSISAAFAVDINGA